MRDDDAHNSANNDGAVGTPDSESDAIADGHPTDDTTTLQDSIGDSAAAGDSQPDDSTSKEDTEATNDAAVTPDGSGLEDSSLDDVDTSEASETVEDDTGSAADSDTSSPRCPGGSVTFEWDSSPGHTIDVNSIVSVSEYLGTERRTRDYPCPDDFFGSTSGEPRWRSPVVVSWYQPLGTSPAWRDFSVAFNRSETLWDFLTQDGQATADPSRLPSGRVRVTSSTGAVRTLELSYLRPRSLQAHPAESPPYELLAFEANESPDHGFKLDVVGVGQGIRAQQISLRVEPGTSFSPEIRFPGEWDNAWFSRAAGQLRIHNGCDTAGTRAFFGRRDLWTWYASGHTDKKHMSIRFIGADGTELRRLNAYNALPAAYGPSFDDCTSEEVIVIDFELIENG